MLRISIRHKSHGYFETHLKQLDEEMHIKKSIMLLRMYCQHGKHSNILILIEILDNRLYEYQMMLFNQK